MSVEELVAVDAALPTEGEVEEAEEEESSDDDSIEPKLLTLKEARESAVQLAAFVLVQPRITRSGPVCRYDECVNHTVGQDCGYCPAPSSSCHSVLPCALKRHVNMLISGYNNYFRSSVVSPFI